MNARGTKYTDDVLDIIKPQDSKDFQAQPDTTIGLDTEQPRMPFVNLETFDETFSTPQRLTPVSRRTLEESGLDTGT
jgi:hypothetical protein